MRQDNNVSEADVRWLVENFYSRVRADDQLAPIFALRLSDEQWPHHLDRMVDFWSSLLRGTARYSGTPMTRHVTLPDITAEDFEQWLALFHATTAEHPNPEVRDRANLMAGRIARSLWMGYQMHNVPERMAADLNVPQPA